MKAQQRTAVAESHDPPAIVTVVRVAGAFLSLLIGSGFSTGQEALQFFVAYGGWGLVGLSLFLVLGVYMTVTFLLIGQKHHFRNNEDVFRYYAGDFVGRLFSLYAVVTLYSVYVVMLSAAGSVLADAYDLPVLAGVVVMGTLVFGALYFGLREIVNVLGALGPLLIVMLLVIALAAIARDPARVAEGARAAAELDLLKASGSWWLSGLLYPAMVATGLASFMPPLAARVTSTRRLVVAGILGPVLFVATLAAVVCALFTGVPEVAELGIPMLYLARNAIPFLAPVFSVVITLCIFTTALPLLWTTLVRFTDDGSRNYHRLAFGLSIFGVFGAMALPFEKLLNLIFPTIGWSGFLLLVLMVAKQVRLRAWR